MTVHKCFVLMATASLAVVCLGGETVKLQALADAGFSSMLYKGANERRKSWGLHKTFKLKSIQEMGVIRFDTKAAKGRKILKATLFIHPTDPKNRLRFIRTSTVNGDWEEGTSRKAYGPPNGACFDYADWDTKRAWAWPGSQLCDVVLGAGNSIPHWSERKKLPGGWIAVPLKPDLIYSMCVGDSDGLALQDGGELSLYNNFVHSVQAGKSAPYIKVELGGALNVRPASPAVRLAPAKSVAKLETGAVKVSIKHDPKVFCWRVKANGKKIGRWQIAHPKKSGTSTFYLEYLDPDKECDVEIVAVSAGGQASEPFRGRVRPAVLARPTISLGKLKAPTGTTGPTKGGDLFSVWACPPLVKISPETGKAMCGDMAAADSSQANGVWDGKKISLFGCRGEYVSCQLVINRMNAPIDVSVGINPFENGKARIERTEIELYKNWYSKNASKQWQPAYCVPLKHGASFSIPDPRRRLAGQKNQSVYVDIYIPKDAKPGPYRSRATVRSDGTDASIPIELEVLAFLMPDKLAFWPQLNVYGWGINAKLLPQAYKLAHQHRNVFFFRGFTPKVSGKGKSIKVDWASYDRQVGPLLSGEAFKSNRRAGHPIEAIALPFKDYWPTDLTQKTYKYKGTWVFEAENNYKKRKKLERLLDEHYMTCPRIEDGLSQGYKDAFVAVQQQFIKHFKAKGWGDTEVQCLFMGKNTHRIQFKVNMWWTTDEPYHWVDWLALRYFAKLWTDNRGPGNARQWVFRADISRPQWQADLLDGIVDNIHFGTSSVASPAMARRMELLVRNGGFDHRFYGGANRDNSSNNGSVVWFANCWLRGGNAALPWQSMGTPASLDQNDRPGNGNSLIAPAKERLGVDLVADMRLKAFRDGEQLVEYLAIFAKKHRLTRQQVRAILAKSIKMEARVAKGASADNADALRFATLKGWQIIQLRRALARAIAE